MPMKSGAIFIAGAIFFADTVMLGGDLTALPEDPAIKYENSL